MDQQTVPGRTSADEIRTRQEAATLLGVHVATLDRWHAEGEGPPRHQPRGKRGKVFYLRSEVLAWALGPEVSL